MVCAGRAGRALPFPSAASRISPALRPIAAIAKKIVESSRNGGPWRLQSFQNRLNPEPPQETSVEPPMTGKALVWDVPGDRLSWAYYRLPFALRAKPADPAMTIFMVWETRSEKILDYKVTVTHKDGRTESLPSVGGFRETVDVGVVRWPEKRMIEWHSVVGAAPPEEIHTTVRVKSGKAQSPGSVRADVSEPLLMWIRSMEKVP